MTLLRHLILLLILTACQSQEQTSQQQNTKPNIIVILADDMGFSDLGCTGSEIETPNLDVLANDGLLFTNCYNTSRCCPTRASLLTGVYQHRAGYGHMDSDLGSEAYQGRFRPGVVTIAQLLQRADYRTIMVGKWHLGHEPENAPLGRGFDRMYGIPKGGGVYYYPCIGRDRQVYLNDQQVFPDSTWYSTDAFTDYALDFAQEAYHDQKPFFMYLAYIAPHFPLQARPEDIAKYRGKYSQGYDYYRKQRFRKQKELGVVASNTALSEADFPDWHTIENPEEEDLKMAVYAAQIDRLDQNVGRLVDKLKELEIYDNTVIMFLSDNGAASVELNTTPNAEFGTRNSWSAYGKNWANVSNTPYRQYKAMTHEGGIITPLIMHWPQGITDHRLVRTPVHINDILPTCLALAGTEYPSIYRGDSLTAIDGRNILPFIQEPSSHDSQSLFWEHQGNQAVREGDLKLVRQHGYPWELYDLESDPSETTNLYETRQDVAEHLEKQYQQWMSRNGVRKWPIEP